MAILQECKNEIRSDNSMLLLWRRFVVCDCRTGGKKLTGFAVLRKYGGLCVSVQIRANYNEVAVISKLVYIKAQSRICQIHRNKWNF